MKIIISPAKKMEECEDLFEPGGLPEFIEETGKLKRRLTAMGEPELKVLFKANDKITHENFLRFQFMDLTRAWTPALLAYVGIQYQSMAPKLFSERQWEYAKRHLRILSGFYGILRPDDRVTPYRLEMQAKLVLEDTADLYGFWGRRLYDSMVREMEAEEEELTILNLASKEYSRAVEPYLGPDCRFVTCTFGEEQNGRARVKATEAKMARGEMVRFMAEHQIENLEEIREFSELGYQYSPEFSAKDHFVYLKKGRS